MFVVSVLPGFWIPHADIGKTKTVHLLTPIHRHIIHSLIRLLPKTVLIMLGFYLDERRGVKIQMLFNLCVLTILDLQASEGACRVKLTYLGAQQTDLERK